MLIACAAVLPLALTGCGNDMSDLRAYIEKVKARKSSDIEPIPKIKPYEPFVYRPADRRDPFEPPEERRRERERADTGISPDFDRQLEPLEQFPLDALRMVGTLTKKGVRHAMIKAPDGNVHLVAKGEHMGQNYGEVVAVKATEVQLVEIVSNGLGGYMKREASIALSE